MDSINNKLPSIKQLQCFLVVAQELNFRRAAERLRMTQPPLTRQIKLLEEMLGCALFIRNTHEVRLTEAGRKLVPKATQLINELTHCVDEMNTEQSRLRMGLTRTLSFDNIPQVSDRINQFLSHKEIDIQNLTSIQLLQLLSKGQMDMVIIGEKSLHSEQDFSFHWIYREPLMLVMPSSHPASLQDKVALADIADLPLFWFPRHANPLYYDKCEAYFRHLSFTLERVKEPDDSLVLLSSIARGKGMTLMPQSMCTFHQQGLCYRTLTDDAAQSLNIDVYVATRKNDTREWVINGIQLLTVGKNA
ncbi:LysR family transcriptional regulator [Pantoea agglomerans]|uniref:LysR family transcriptional regulator n=1 Tax=Enterobacter agglomerans TaxID=549 RepID=A0ACC5RRS3_ENTAG|nr:LysR family transcriptional regulator [Pantoea agglomerans]MBK4727256.1 LysR family transcriptional regulator [Pantoea agglomerans]